MDIALGLMGSGLTEMIKSKAAKVKDNCQKGPDIQETFSRIHADTKKAKKEVTQLDRSVEAYFIGPRAENIEYFSQLIQKAIDSHRAARVEYEMEDARHITRRMQNEPSFLDAQDKLDRAFTTVLSRLKDLSPPFYSSRYYGHMNWETTIPSLLGSFATLLYNPNNCAFEGGPYTTLLEIQVITQFAKMFDFPPMLSFSKDNKPEANYSWGHLTCGGTVANCEAFWAARNCRFLSLSLRRYIKTLGNKNCIESVEVNLVDGTSKKLVDLNAWEIMNISNQETMNLYDRVFKKIYGADADKPENYSVYQNGVAAFSVGKVGLMEMYEDLADINCEHPLPEWAGLKRLPKPKVFVSATAHYSIHKSLSILGLGEQAVEKVVVDLDSRVDICALRQKLENCWVKKIPVLGVVGIVGTTEESTIDSLTSILELKEEYRKKGLYFHFHIDGAYGGYFVSMIRVQDKCQSYWNSISSYVTKQLHAFSQADSITFDPHKTGYVPYTCGGIIYRNHRLRDNLSFSAPYIYTGAEPNMSIYGVEGSKPGSSVTSVYLSLQVLPLVRAGHGELLERTMMNTKIFTSCLYRIKEIDVEYKYEQGKLTERFDCFLLPRLNCEKESKPELREAEMDIIKQISASNPTQLEQLVTGEQSDCHFQDVYYNLGPDLNIVCYGLNFKDKQTNQFNRSLKKYNEFNRTLIKLSKPVGTDVSVRMKDLFVSETEIKPTTYGKAIFDDYLKRHNLVADGEEEIVFIRSTIMNAFFTELGVDPTERIEASNRTFIKEIVENGCETLLYLKWR